MWEPTRCRPWVSRQCVRRHDFGTTPFGDRNSARRYWIGRIREVSLNFVFTDRAGALTFSNKWPGRGDGQHWTYREITKHWPGPPIFTTAASLHDTANGTTLPNRDRTFSISLRFSPSTVVLFTSVRLPSRWGSATQCLVCVAALDLFACFDRVKKARLPHRNP